MHTLYSMPDSGNSYKVRLTLAHLDMPYRHVEVDTRKGDTRSPEFLAKNPNGKAPLLELADGRFLAESNAIMLYLAEGSPLIPADSYERALMFQWLFFEQYSHEPSIAVRRSLLRYPHMKDLATPDRLAETLEDGNKALGVMETQLSKTDFLVGDNPGIADLSLYAYTHTATDGGFDLSAFPAIQAWLDRIAALPGHIAMDHLPPC